MCSSTLVTQRLKYNFKETKDAVTQYKIKAGNIKTNRKVKVNFCPTYFRATKIVM